MFDPEDVEIIFRHEGKYPFRGDALKFFEVLRERRPGTSIYFLNIILAKQQLQPNFSDIFSDRKGLIVDNWEKWQEMRSKVSRFFVGIFTVSLIL